jgi:hypothetical protein
MNLRITYGDFQTRSKGIAQAIRDLPVQSGDIIFRMNYNKIMGVPFGQIVGYLTRSKYVHSAIFLKEGRDLFLMNLDDAGTKKQTLDRFLQDCQGDEISIYRLKEWTPGLLTRIEDRIRHHLACNYHYDFEFSFKKKKRMYCTQQVCKVYEEVGVEIMKPVILKKILTKMDYQWFVPINWAVNSMFQVGFPTKYPLYFVGNEQHGMIASPKLQQVFKCEIIPLLEP